MSDTTPGSAPSIAEDAEPEGGWNPGDRVHLIFNLVLLVMGAGYLVMSFGLVLWNEQGPREGFFPLIAVVLFLACMVADTVRLILRLVRDPRQSVGRFEWRVAAVLGSIVVYLVLVGILGHLLTSILVVGGLLRLFASRPWWQTILTAVLAAVITDFVFTELLGFRLTAGLLGIGFSAWM